ncbi:MAG: rod shape-determining protein RodA [Bacteroidales bacterium]|nr:rod shape-determining protein RodA [Bacteroidales bacterium]
MRSKNIIGKIDIWLLIIYLALATVGILSIYAAAFNEAHPSIIDASQNYGKQLIFLGVSLFVGFIILLIDAKFFNALAYVFYGLSIVFLLMVFVVGSKISGSTSWIHLGPLSFQPSEFAKFGTALALAHYLGKLDTDLTKFKTKVIAYGIIILPMLLILAQGDAGSASVFIIFLLVIYREGMGGKILIIGLVAATIFVLSLCVSKWYMMTGLGVIYAFFLLIIDRTKKNVWLLTGILIAACAFVFSVDFAFNHILKPHQQTRINIILGKEKDTKGVGYNLNQSMIAIGSGGFSGKGYLNGTMTKYNFVPEQHTDFIFCTVGEESGFVGCFFLIALYLALMLRIIHLAERQRSTFSRIYGYGIACIFFFHFAINIGMTIGLVPVIGIPLPFLSYGGSSLLMFSMMIFVFLKQDANRMNIL